MFIGFVNDFAVSVDFFCPILTGIYTSPSKLSMWPINPWKLGVTFFKIIAPALHPIQKPILSLLQLLLSSLFLDFFPNFLLIFCNFYDIFLKLSEQYLCVAFLWINWSLYTKAWVSHAICVRASGERGGKRRRVGKKEEGGPLTLKSRRQGAMHKTK